MTSPVPAVSEWTVHHRRIPWEPASRSLVLPLGRNVVHDSRNLWYRHQRTAGTLVTVLHTRNVPVLDQGSVGSCTGDGEVGCLGTTPNWEALPAGHPVMNQAEAYVIYSGAETIDGNGTYPPNDYGSSGPSAAKAAMQLGLISGYTHCLSLADVLDALQTQAVSIGINWWSSFDSPPSSGLLAISSGAYVRGGHEPMLRGIDVTAQEVFGDNSWGTSWGPLGGSFRMSWATLERLLAEDGDGTVSVPLTQPAPVPVPPVPVPVPTPIPVPTPTPVPPVVADAADQALWSATRAWAAGRHAGANKYAAAAVETWARAKHLS